MSGMRYILAALLAAILAGGAHAQTMRFETSVGSFDMVLNPTGDANLQPIVDNIVAYIGLGRYHHTVINRADEGFVLQMGSFLGFPSTPNDFLGLLQEIRRLDPVVVDANGDGQVDFSALSNTRGTVSLALSSGGPNTGTSSFFVNLGDNSSLNSQGFVPFARINDMTTVDRIMDLERTNLTGNPSDLTFGDVPLTEQDRLVILKSVRVLQAAPEFSFTGPIAAALEQEAANQAAEAQAAAAMLEAPQAALAATESLIEGADSAIVPESIPSSGGVPEPAAGVLALIALAAASRRRRR